MNKVLLVLLVATIALSVNALSSWAQPSGVATSSQTVAGDKNNSGPQNYLDPKTGMEFILIKGGCYFMGSPSDEVGRWGDEGPQHEVCVDDFMLAKYEVTNLQYRLFQPNHACKPHEGNILDGDLQPVVDVSWKEAINYTRWMSKQSGSEYRLPTEAEWEYAARAGSNGGRYWGDVGTDTCDYANIGDRTAKLNWQNSAVWTLHDCIDGFTVTAPIGSFKANALGLHDMLGNVWEWTADWYSNGYDVQSPQDNPLGPPKGQYRVLRGGSWYSGPKNTRSARRSWFRPDSHTNSLGYRLAFSLEKKPE